MNVLIADDEKSIADGIAAILEHSGFTTEVVYDGKCAYQKVCNNVFDGIVLDIMMPYMDGIEVMQRLHDNGDTIPILLLTAKSQVEDKIEGLTLGADDYLAKPFNSGELVARVGSMIRRSRITRTDALTIGNLRLSVSDKFISCRDTALSLSGGETEIMRQLIIHAGKHIPLSYLAREEGIQYGYYGEYRYQIVEQDGEITVFPEKLFSLDAIKDSFLKNSSTEYDAVETEYLFNYITYGTFRIICVILAFEQKRYDCLDKRCLV